MKHAFQQLFVHRTMLDSTIYVELLREKHVNCECWVFCCFCLKVTNVLAIRYYSQNVKHIIVEIIYIQYTCISNYIIKISEYVW